MERSKLVVGTAVMTASSFTLAEYKQLREAKAPLSKIRTRIVEGTELENEDQATEFRMALDNYEKWVEKISEAVQKGLAHVVEWFSREMVRADAERQLWFRAAWHGIPSAVRMALDWQGSRGRSTSAASNLVDQERREVAHYFIDKMLRQRWISDEEFMLQTRMWM